MQGKGVSLFSGVRPAGAAGFERGRDQVEFPRFWSGNVAAAEDGSTPAKQIPGDKSCRASQKPVAAAISSHTGTFLHDAAITHAFMAMNLTAEKDFLIDPGRRCGQPTSDVFVADVGQVEVGPGQAWPPGFLGIVRA